MPDANRRDIVISFRVTPLQAAHLDAAGRALKNPRTRADMCRAASLHAAKQKVPPPSKPVRRPAKRLPALDTRQLASILGHAGKIGSNVNQLARVANSSGALPTVQALREIGAEISAIRASLTAVLRGGENEGGGDDN